MLCMVEKKPSLQSPCVYLLKLQLDQSNLGFQGELFYEVCFLDPFLVSVNQAAIFYAVEKAFSPCS